MLELIHAWSNNGQGEAGFTIVHRTTGMSKQTARTLEMLSGMDLPATGSVPPIRAHRIIMLDGIICSVLSSITQTTGPSPDRPCRVAHHLVLTPAERPKVGPVGLLMSGWFREAWDDTESPEPTPAPLPDHSELPSCPTLDPEWIRLLNQRATAHAATSILVPLPTCCINVVAAIEQTLPPSHQWELTFLTNTDRMRDGVLLLAAQVDSPPATRIAAAKEGVVLPLQKPPAHSWAREGTGIEPPQNLVQDRVELVPNTLRLDPVRIPGLVIMLMLLAAAAVAITIAVIGGWFT